MTAHDHPNRVAANRWVHRRQPSPHVGPDTGRQAAGQSSGAPLVYTVAEVAAQLKVSPGTVRNMIDQGQLYALRLHVRRIVVPKWALDALLGRPEPPSASRTSPSG